MGRRRKSGGDIWLPPRVYRGKSSYEWRPAGGKATVLHRLQKDAEGNIVEPPALKRAVLEAYESAEKVARRPKNMDYWITKFLFSGRFEKLGRDTQSDYTRYIEIRANEGDPKSRNGIRAVFGRMSPTAVRKTHVRRYMDHWGAAGKEVTANRHLSCLQTLFNWMMEYDSGIDQNPAHGVTKFKERSRAVYVEDEDYEKLLSAAFASNSPYMASVIEIAYLCGLRNHEVVKLNIEDITPKGLFIRRGKGSKNEITEISPRLQAAIDFAISLHSGPEPLRNRPLIRTTRGQRPTTSALKIAFRKIVKAAGLVDVRLHDMKKKAGTDGKDLGHMTKAMTAMYNVKPKVKKATK